MLPGPMGSLRIPGARAQPSTLTMGLWGSCPLARPIQGPTLQPPNPRKYLPSPPQAALGVTDTSRQESDSEL